MIVGVGIDIVQIARIEHNLVRYGDAFSKRILTQAELTQFCHDQDRNSVFLGSRFAVKEAFVKALGTGMRHGLSWSQIEIQTADNGQPHLFCQGRAREMLMEREIVHQHVSISHERAYAVAMVVLEK